jgi:hypothetical protein
MNNIFNILLALSLSISAFSNNPQYICMNKMFGCTTQQGCWNEGQPSSLTQASVDLFLSSVGNVTGGPLRRLCLGFQIDALDGSTASTHAATLAQLLALSEANNLPIVLSLDAFEFWEGRPDLWNWWNSTLAGFDPANAANVEWTAPSPVNATMIAWADWGAQFRKQPHPNLASPVFRAAVADAIRPLASVVGAWYNALDPGKKYLLAGVKAGWEIWIGTNFYFYADGNRYVNAPPEGDPTSGAAGSVQLGYAAMCTLGLACDGSVTPALLDAVVSDYFDFTTSLIAGFLPRSKVFTHAGTFPFVAGSAPDNGVVYNSPMPARSTHAAPGWSFYHAAYNVSTGAGLDAALAALQGTHWAASEFGYMGGNNGTEQQQWETALRNAIGYKNNRIVDIYNWESLDAAALAAIAAVVSDSPPCLIDAASDLTSAMTDNGTVALLSWVPGPSGESAMLLVSTCPATLISGLLASPDVTATPLPAGTSNFNLTTAGWEDIPLYWQVTTLGCNGSQQMVSEVRGVSEQTEASRFAGHTGHISNAHV